MYIKYGAIFCILFFAIIGKTFAEDKFIGLPEPGHLKDEWWPSNFHGNDGEADRVEDSDSQKNSPAPANGRDNKKNNNNKDEKHIVRSAPLVKLHSQDVNNQGLPANTNSRRLPRILRVGPGREFARPSEAAAVAQDGDTVEIDAAGNYRNDEVFWRRNKLSIKGVGGRPLITADRELTNGKALWVIQGNDIKIENIEFTRARVRDRNGAGLRLEGGSVFVTACYFHHNQNGILGGAKNSNVNIEYSEFAYNGTGDGFTHNIYIGKINRLTMRFNYIHHAIVGHNVKSRARENLLFYNRIMDESNGRASYQVDLPNGGTGILVGNVIQQGQKAENWSVIAFAAEGFRYNDNQLIMVNNTIVNDRHTGQFIRYKKGSMLKVVNNIFAGKAKVDNVGILDKFNLVKNLPKFIDRNKFNYHIPKNSSAIDKSISPGKVAGIELRARYEYKHKASATLRNIIHIADYGAFEYRPR